MLYSPVQPQQQQWPQCGYLLLSTNSKCVHVTCSLPASISSYWQHPCLLHILQDLPQHPPLNKVPSNNIKSTSPHKMSFTRPQAQPRRTQGRQHKRKGYLTNVRQVMHSPSHRSQKWETPQGDQENDHILTFMSSISPEARTGTSGVASEPPQHPISVDLFG